MLGTHYLQISLIFSALSRFRCLFLMVILLVFTALHQDGLSHEQNVHLSVCPSVNRVNCDKTKETCADVLYYMKEHSS